MPLADFEWYLDATSASMHLLFQLFSIRTQSSFHTLTLNPTNLSRFLEGTSGLSEPRSLSADQQSHKRKGVD
jgi:hypothetical protein